MLKAPNPADSWADWEDAHELPWWDDPVSPLDGDGKTLNRKLVAKLQVHIHTVVYLFVIVTNDWTYDCGLLRKAL